LNEKYASINSRKHHFFFEIAKFIENKPMQDGHSYQETKKTYRGSVCMRTNLKTQKTLPIKNTPTATKRPP